MNLESRKVVYIEPDIDELAPAIEVEGEDRGETRSSLVTTGGMATSLLVGLVTHQNDWAHWQKVIYDPPPPNRSGCLPCSFPVPNASAMKPNNVLSVTSQDAPPEKAAVSCPVACISHIFSGGIFTLDRVSTPCFNSK